MTDFMINLLEPLIKPWAVFADFVSNLPFVNTIALPDTFILDYKEC
jgi:hypothetical protein